MLWVVCISLCTSKAGGPHCLGDLPQEEAAGRAYDEYALQHLGKGAPRLCRGAQIPPSTYNGRATAKHMHMALLHTSTSHIWYGAINYVNVNHVN